MTIGTFKYNQHIGEGEIATLEAEYDSSTQILKVKLDGIEREIPVAPGESVHPDYLGNEAVFGHMEHALYKARKTVRDVLEAALTGYNIQVY